MSMAEEADRADEDAVNAAERAEAAKIHARRTHALAQRQEWEARAMAFLAAGNARLLDGTPIRDWMSVQDELRNAEAHGVPLSESARMAIIKMGAAQKAIRKATAAAKVAAERAYAEWQNTKQGAKARLAAEERAHVRAARLAEEGAPRPPNAQPRPELPSSAPPVCVSRPSPRMPACDSCVRCMHTDLTRVACDSAHRSGGSGARGGDEAAEGGGGVDAAARRATARDSRLLESARPLWRRPKAEAAAAAIPLQRRGERSQRGGSLRGGGTAPSGPRQR